MFSSLWVKTPEQVWTTGARAKPIMFVNSTLILFCVIMLASVENLKNFSRILLVVSLINLKKTKYNDYIYINSKYK